MKKKLKVVFSSLAFSKSYADLEFLSCIVLSIFEHLKEWHGGVYCLVV
jgi:hypothetical protein